MIEPLIIQALVSLGFDKGWVLYGEEIDGLVWVDNVPNKPTNKQILDKIKEL